MVCTVLSGTRRAQRKVGRHPRRPGWVIESARRSLPIRTETRSVARSTLLREARTTCLYSITGLGGYTPIVNGRWLAQGDATISKGSAPKRTGRAFGAAMTLMAEATTTSNHLPALRILVQGLSRCTADTLTRIHIPSHRYGFAGGLDYRLTNGSGGTSGGCF